jgi:UDP-N-acetylmuramoyl-L-alanyl-D-glutamate--2,6-diaminopimelate ligase
VVTDPVGAQVLAGATVPILSIVDPRSRLGDVSARVYATDSQRPRLFGVTGTNGKTTAVYLLTAILEAVGRRTGMSSTSEKFIAGERYSSRLTTPEADEIHAFIARMSEAKVTDAAIEISAHALSRHRVDALHWDVVGFTNFSQDHLDDYGSMDEYFEAKLSLFTPERSTRGVVVLDSPWCDRVVKESRIPVTTVGLVGGPTADWTVTVTGRHPDSTTFALAGPDGAHLESRVAMVGDFSAVNAALAIVMCLEGGISLEAIREGIGLSEGITVEIPGRTEIVSGQTGPTFYVDYGHTPEAFATTLQALRAITPGTLIMVCGADGDRDASKREAMGRNAARESDVLIVTDYHPRTEDPAAIRAQLIAGARDAHSTCDIREVSDPRDAVRLAVSLATTGDTILYAGPGHEDYRDVGTHRISYSAREDARNALHEAGWS